MLLLTLAMLVLIEAMYILYLKIPEWTPDYPYQGWLVATTCKEVALSGWWLLWLFWILHVFVVLGY